MYVQDSRTREKQFSHPGENTSIIHYEFPWWSSVVLVRCTWVGGPSLIQVCYF